LTTARSEEIVFVGVVEFSQGSLRTSGRTGQMADWVVALLSVGAGSGLAVVLVQVRKIYRERTIRRVVDWSLEAGKKDPQWADRTLSRLLGASPESDPPIEPDKAVLTDSPNDPPFAGPTTDESADA
jgi:hypothetical protein